MPNNWVNKIHNHTILPATEVWQRIANELDKEHLNRLKIKMFAYEITSPAVVWQNIIKRLYKNENIKQYSKRNKLIPVYFRIAVAAVILAVVLITITSNNKKITANEVAIEKTNDTQHSLQKIKKEAFTTPLTPQEKSRRLKEQVTYIKPSKLFPLQSLQILPTGSKINEVQELAQAPGKNSKEKLQNTNGQIPMSIALLDVSNNNISITGANEQSLKTSSKFSNLVNSSSNISPHIKENIDIIIEESYKWRSIVETWRKKIVDNSNAPSINIIELSKMLEENK